jgi:hypothetical protein
MSALLSIKDAERKLRYVQETDSNLSKAWQLLSDAFIGSPKEQSDLLPKAKEFLNRYTSGLTVRYRAETKFALSKIDEALEQLSLDDCDDEDDPESSYAGDSFGYNNLYNKLEG